MSSTASIAHAPERHPTKAETLAAFFWARPGQWIDARRIAHVGGLLSWRTRVSDIRRPPFNLEISNRTRTIRTANGSSIVTSEYRLGPPDGARR